MYRIRFACLALLVAFPLVRQAGAAADPAAVERVDALLRNYGARTPVPGLSVVVADHAGIAFSAGYGVEEIGSTRPMTAESTTAIGSLAKSFVALATMQLVEQSRIGLDDRIVEHLPWFRTAERELSDRITVRMLLSNTSGLPSLEDGSWWTDVDDGPDTAERGALSLARNRMRREPGTSFEYSNEGWVVLGLVIESVSGEPLDAHLDRHVLAPLGMTRSTNDPAGLDSLGALRGHLVEHDRPVPAPILRTRVALAAGSLFHASANDLGRYLAALLAGGRAGGRRLVGPSSIEQMWTPAVHFPGLPVEDGGTGTPAGYGFGWITGEIDGRRVVHHAGGTLTASSQTMILPDDDLAVSVLLTLPPLDPYRYDSAGWLANNVLHAWRGEPMSDFARPRRRDPTANTFELPPERQGDFVGIWIDEAGRRLEIRPDGAGGLEARFRMGPYRTTLGLDFASEGSVVLRSLTHTLPGTFRMSPTGIAETLVLEGMFAGSFRRVRDPEGRSWIACSPDGSIGVPLPEGWVVDWSEEGFAARDPSRPAVRVHGGWGQEDPDRLVRRFALDGASLVEHRESVAGRAWREVVWVPAEETGGEGRLLLATETGAGTFHLLAEGPADTMTGLARTLAGPVTWGLEAP